MDQALDANTRSCGEPAAPSEGGPRKLYVELTTDCDLDCAMCMRRSWDEPGGAMDERTFGRIVAQASRTPGLDTLQFSGFGEPMLHARFLDFLGAAKGAGLRVEVVTNGQSLDRPMAERLVDLRLDRLMVSADGAEPEGRRLLHAAPFDGVRRALGELNAARHARRAAEPEVGLVFVATRSNIGQLPALRRLSPVLGFSRILVTNLVAYTPELSADVLYGNWAIPSVRPHASPWTPQVDLPVMADRSEAAPVIERLRDSGALVRVNGARLDGDGMCCRFVTEGRLAVTWDGRVSPCLPLMHSYTYYFRGQARRMRAYHVGDVNRASLHDIWRDHAYRAFRDRVRAFDFAPCIDCSGCFLRDSNETDCYGDEFPRCGECLWAAGLIQCP